MLVLPANGSMDHHSSTTTTKVANAMMKGSRRKRSKGTIAGFASGKDGGISSTGSNVETSNDLDSVTSRKSVQIGSSPSIKSSQQQNNIDASPPPPKQSTSARIALLCAQNAIRLGARTQLNLCPPGRSRREMQAALRQRTRVQQQQMQNMSVRSRINYSSEGYFGLEKLLGSDTLEEYEAQEEEYLMNTNAFELDTDEEASSGDEDDLCDLDDLFSDHPTVLDDHDKYMKLREPLYTALGTDANNAAGASSIGNSGAGRLPFNRRKMKFFDLVSPDEVSSVRTYLRKEEKRAKRRSTLVLKRHLKRAQAEERRRRRLERGEAVQDDFVDFDHLNPEEAALLDGGVSRFEQVMTPAMAAALLTESLALNSKESIEGMAKCYDGIVAAGVAVLDAMTVDPTSPPSADDKNRPSRSEIISALAPLLITTLDQPSGEVILMLAKLRRMCGTERYRRRFVQRVVPSLIRPPGGAIWCLRHQNDMEAILAAAELIFDAAFDVFSKGWYERGQLMLADSKRAETLSTAAKQLRSLSSEPVDGLVLGFASHAGRRRMPTAEVVSNDPLAEWEVIAVDKQIRVSISHILSTDWTKASVTEVPKPQFRRSVSANRRYSSMQQNGEMSPRITSPIKAQSTYLKHPQSPPSLPVFGASHPGIGQADNFSVTLNDGSESPPSTLHHSKSTDSKGTYDNNGRKSPTNTFIIPPPKSPKSPLRHSDMHRDQQVAGASGMSPKRSSKDYSTTGPTPLSPSTSSIGTSASAEVASMFKPNTTTSSVANSPSGTGSHYRMLTSTAAERKRTVAACRALRAQIQRFEDAFIQLHGRPPKGAADRAPLATTYAQYREWKRAIRADAACRIQALFRGARTRWRLLRASNPAVTRVIMKRAGRSGYPASSSAVGQMNVPSGTRSVDTEVVATSTLNDGSAKVTGDAQWASQAARRRTGTTERAGSETITAIPKPFSPNPASAVLPAQSDMANLSFADLQARKRELKQQLKQYDMNFARRHGRMPVKAEKEPIRHLYEAYNSLKHQLGVIEDDSRASQSTSASFSSVSASSVSQRAASPVSISDTSASGNESAASDAKSNALLARSKRKLPKAAAPPILPSSSTASVVSTTPTNATSGTPDLAALKAEKSTLHQMLRAYEKDFFRENRRQVSSFADIRPVASQYRRYKDIKKAIAAIQQGGER